MRTLFITLAFILVSTTSPGQQAHPAPAPVPAPTATTTSASTADRTPLPLEEQVAILKAERDWNQTAERAEAARTKFQELLQKTSAEHHCTGITPELFCIGAAAPPPVRPAPPVHPKK